MKRKWEDRGGSRRSVEREKKKKRVSWGEIVKLAKDKQHWP